jgi:hypothetical protein
MTAKTDGVIRAIVDIMEISSALRSTRKWRWYDESQRLEAREIATTRVSTADQNNHAAELKQSPGAR